jgi:hypothetical protein
VGWWLIAERWIRHQPKLLFHYIFAHWQAIEFVKIDKAHTAFYHYLLAFFIKVFIVDCIVKCLTAVYRSLKNKGHDKRHKMAEQAASRNDLVAPLTWAQRLKRVFNIDITLCPLCGGAMRVIADITDPDIIQKILDHIEAQPPPVESATAIQSKNMPG